MESPSDEICDSILSLFSKSIREEHQHICTVICAMHQELKDRNLPLTPVIYLGAAVASLDSLSLETDTPPHAVESVTTILSFILPRLPLSVLKSKGGFVSGVAVRVLRLKSVTAGAAVAGLKCLSYLLTVMDHGDWTEVSQSYGMLLSYMTDSRPKVREQSHLSIRDALQCFQRTQVLASASENITNIFKEFILLVGGSKSTSDEGLTRAQDVLYVLDAFKKCLPLMSTKFVAHVLGYFRTLLELRQPIVARRVMDSVYELCLSTYAEVPAEALLELLCSLASPDYTEKMSADAIAFTARLLSVGMIRIFSVNKEICVVKLPVVFNKLKDVLASEHEEAIYSASEAFKSLIHTCIDESLIKQGVNRIQNKTTTGPTTIEKLCATTESLLDYQYGAVWEISFQIISGMFDKLGEHSSYFMKGTLKNLADMQKLSDEDFPYRKQLHECVGSALGAMGVEAFLGVLPLNVESSNLSEVNVWLFPVLKQYTVGARLSYFTEIVLGIVGMMRGKSKKLELEGHIVSSRSVDSLVYSLWSLLPAFCNYPMDTAESFKDLEKTLCSALREQHDVRGIICSSLHMLIRQNKEIVEGKDTAAVDVSPATQRAQSRYTPQVAADNLEVVAISARDLLTILLEIFLESVKDDGGCLQSVIGDLASIAEKKVVTRLFTKTMHRLLEVTQQIVREETSKNGSMDIDNGSAKNSASLAWHNLRSMTVGFPLLNSRARLLDLAVSFLPGLGPKELGLLFSAIKPALQDEEGLIQKGAYRVLSLILKNSDQFLSAKLDELLPLFIEVLPSCHLSAKRHRLDCLYFLIAHLSKTDGLEQKWRDSISSFLTDIILALKESNKKTRIRAYEVLVQIGHACEDEKDGGKENLYQIFNMVAGGLAGETPHMISAAMKGLARLVYEFSDLVPIAYRLLPSTFLLLQRKNREIIKANLGFLKVLVAKSQDEGLQVHLKSIVEEGLLKWQDAEKGHFKAKVKLLLEMLIKKCGLAAVKAVMPGEHMKLLTNIRKVKEHNERKLAAGSDDSKSKLSHATTSRLSKWNHSKIFSDFDDEEDIDMDNMDAKTVVSGRKSKVSSKKSRAVLLRSKRNRTGKSLPDDFDQAEDEPLDLLDRDRTRSALRASGSSSKRMSESDDEAEFDSEGRLIILEGEKRKKSTPYTDSKSQAGSVTSSRRSQKRRKTSETGRAYTGNEYASKKASGDVKKKDKLEPYAYWPLDRKMMSRRPEHRAVARHGMTSVVKMTKRLEGMKLTSLRDIRRKNSEQ